MKELLFSIWVKLQSINDTIFLNRFSNEVKDDLNFGFTLTEPTTKAVVFKSTFDRFLEKYEEANIVSPVVEFYYDGTFLFISQLFLKH